MSTLGVDAQHNISCGLNLIKSDFFHHLRKNLFEVNEMQEINYHELWELEQPTQRPHKRRADELGIRMTDIPVSPVLTRLKESIRRIEELYNIRELLEEGINVDELLNQFTEFQLIAYIEELGFEHSIALAEIEALCRASSRLSTV